VTAVIAGTILCVMKRPIMNTIRLLAISIVAIVAPASQISAQDLSRYRDFQLG
jgi:hypothetical protein